MRPEARSIAGFITVQAPNSGSPLANCGNAGTVARGLFAVSTGVLSFPVPPPGPNQELGKALAALAGGTLSTPEGSRRRRRVRRASFQPSAYTPCHPNTGGDRGGQHG